MADRKPSRSGTVKLATQSCDVDADPKFHVDALPVYNVLSFSSVSNVPLFSVFLTQYRNFLESIHLLGLDTDPDRPDPGCRSRSGKIIRIHNTAEMLSILREGTCINY
jgi:hypothetical protein